VSSLLSANHNAVLSTLMYCELCICAYVKNQGKSTVMEIFTSLVDVSAPIYDILVSFCTAHTLFQKYNYLRSIL